MRLLLWMCLFAIVFCFFVSAYMIFFTVLDELLASNEAWHQISQEEQLSLAFILLALITISARQTKKVVDLFRGA